VSEELAYRIIDILRGRNCTCYLAGGAARDELLGRKPNDYDLATESPPEMVIHACVEEELKAKLAGASFPVVIVSDGKSMVEVATFRKDVYHGTSDKDVTITTTSSIVEDSARRDFTINTMYFCPRTDELVDPCGGKNDLDNKVIRAPGVPEDRLREDPCRILRACRFLCLIGGVFDDATYSALKRNVHLVGSHVHPDRIRKEVLKVMGYQSPSIFWRALNDIGGLEYVSPGLHMCYNFDGGKYHIEDVFTHCMIVGDHLPSDKPLLRLAGYLHDIGKPNKLNSEGGFYGHDKEGEKIVRSELKHLHFSTRDVNYISTLIKHHMRTIGDKSTPRAIRRMLKAFGEEGIDYREWLKLRIADRIGNLIKPNYSVDYIKGILSKIREEMNPTRSSAFSTTDLAIDGNDVMRILDIQPGKLVGVILRSLLDVVIDNPELNTKETLTKLIIDSRR